MAIAVQVLFVREFMVVFFGNELCLGIILGGWLIGIAIGTGIGGRISRQVTRTLPLFIVLQAFICLSPFVQIGAIRLVRSILNVPAGEYISLLPLIASAFLITLPFSFTIGLIFPCACTLFPEEDNRKARPIGLVYIFEAAGSLIGGIVLTFFMIAQFKPYEIIAIIAIPTLLNSAVLRFCVRHSTVPWVSWLCITLCAFNGYMLLSGHISRLDDRLVQQRWYSYKNHLNLMFSADSPYQNVAVASAQDQYSLFGNGQYVTSYPDPYQAAFFAHFTLAQHPSPAKILLVGGGATGTIQEMLKHPIRMLHYVEVDPLMIEAGIPYLAVQDKNALADKRVGLFFKDGRYFIQHGTEQYDMIILHLPDPSTAMLNRFYTIEFFKEARKRLAPGGVLITGITGSDTYLGQDAGVYASSLYHTLNKVFTHIVVAPGTRNYFFAADVPGAVSSDPNLLARRFESRGIQSDYFTPYHFTMLFPRERSAFLARELEQQSAVQINTDACPITYYYNLVLWESIAGSKGRAHLFQGLVGRLNLLVVSLTLLFLVRVAYVLRTRRRLAAHLTCNALLAIAAAGFAGMSLEIILLLSFQNIYGYVYRQVGLIIAFFMLGLAAGGWQMNRLIAGRERSWVTLLTLLSFSLGVYAMGMPYLIDLFSFGKASAAGNNLDLRFIFLGLVTAAGWLTGLEFPLVSKIFINRYPTGTVAGWVNGCDHLGACLGALLTGTVLVPVLGMYQSCLIAGTINLMSGALLLIYMLQKGR
jgi:spermidine synthase